MKSQPRVLFVGESWIKHTIHMKGFDHFVSIEYQEGAGYFLKCLRDANLDVTYIRSHEVSDLFPSTQAELAKYDVLILSDIGANTFLLTNDTFLRSKVRPNLLALAAQFVDSGGGLVKIGGYMSFTGIDARARYGMSPLAAVLPVEMLPSDDRIEMPEGITPTVVAAGHAAISDVPSTDWPALLGYNRTIAKDGSTVIANVGNDPLIVTGAFGKGRSLAFMSDVAPHWAPPEFMEWRHYPALWISMVRWAARNG